MLFDPERPVVREKDVNLLATVLELCAQRRLRQRYDQVQL